MVLELFLIRKKVYLLFTFLAAIFLFESCSNKKLESEEELLLNFVEKTYSDAVPKESGLYYIESGFSNSTSLLSDNPKAGDTIILACKAYLLTDTSEVFFDKDFFDPYVYVYMRDNVIEGFEEGIGYTKKGISATFIIPSDLAYGDNKVGIIPPYSTLIFDVRIIDVK